MPFNLDGGMEAEWYNFPTTEKNTEKNRTHK